MYTRLIQDQHHLRSTVINLKQLCNQLPFTLSKKELRDLDNLAVLPMIIEESQKYIVTVHATLSVHHLVHADGHTAQAARQIIENGFDWNMFGVYGQITTSGRGLWVSKDNHSPTPWHSALGMDFSGRVLELKDVIPLVNYLTTTILPLYNGQPPHNLIGNILDLILNYRSVSAIETTSNDQNNWLVIKEPSAISNIRIIALEQ